MKPDRLSSRALRPLSVLSCLTALLLVTAPAVAQRAGGGRPLNQAPARPAPGPTFELPSAPGAVLLEYSVIHHMLAQRDPEPLMRIYADGRVRIHHPVYLANPGDYETFLSRRELSELVSFFASDGLLDFDDAAVAAERRAAEAAEIAGGIAWHTSDASDTVIEVHLASYRPAAAAAVTPDFRKNIRWRNIYTDAERFTGVAGIQALASAQRRLQEILERDDLEPVAAA